MAIDTAEERRNIAFLRGVRLPGVTPNASTDSEWRAQAARVYSGIAAGEPAPAGPAIAPLIIRRRRARRR